MQVIREADKKIAAVWSNGKVQQAVYRPLTYVIRLEVDNGTLLHNAVSGELIFIDTEETKKFSSLPCEYAPWMDELIKKHFIVKSDMNDEKTVCSLRSAMQLLNRRKEIVSYTVLPTTCCNARCFYCYESKIVHENMSDETADRLVDFIDTHHGDNPVYISWFGGEPLVGIRQIDRISSALKAKNIEFSSSMISNGYLFTEEIAKRCKEDWNLKKVQITLDGTEKVYNSTKNYKSPCASPYRRVLDNIGYLIGNGIRVNIRLNLGLHNADDLTELVKELAETFPEKKLLMVYSYLLFEDCGFTPTHFETDELAQLENKKYKLDELIARSGFAIAGLKLPKLKVNACMADSDTSVTVSPLGKLGKCEHFTTEHLVGDLDTGVTDIQKVKWFKENERLPHCGSCPVFPNCIHLKICEAERPCSPIEEKRKQKKAKQSMAYFYKKFSCDDKNETEPDDNPDC